MAAKRKSKPKKAKRAVKKTKAAPRKRKRTVRRAAPKAVKPAAAAPPPELEDAIAEPLADMSGMHRVAEHIISSQRGVDEDEYLQFREPTLVIETLQKGKREEPREESEDPEDD